MPVLRATLISGLVSMVKVVMPSTSRGAQARVGQGGEDGLAGQLQLAAAGVLGELRRADADDRGCARQEVATSRHCSVPRGRRTVTSETASRPAVDAAHRDATVSSLDADDLAGHPHRVAGVVRHPEADAQALHARRAGRPSR